MRVYFLLKEQQFLRTFNHQQDINAMKIWIARDVIDNSLWIYQHKPYKEHGYYSNTEGFAFSIAPVALYSIKFNDLTFENSPIELDILSGGNYGIREEIQ